MKERIEDMDEGHFPYFPMSKRDGKKTDEQTLGGGNIVVH